MKEKNQFLLARISPDFIDKSSFEWVVDGRRPFMEVDPADIEDKILTNIYDLYVSVYKNIGKNLYLACKEMLLKYNRWILIVDFDEQIVGFALYRTHSHGIKLGLIGSDNSKQVKKALKKLVRRSLNVSGVFGEVSPPLEYSLKGYTPKVQAKYAHEILDKDCKSGDDEWHYIRDIGNLKDKRKMLVGKPLLTKEPGRQS